LLKDSLKRAEQFMAETREKGEKKVRTSTSFQFRKERKKNEDKRRNTAGILITSRPRVLGEINLLPVIGKKADRRLCHEARLRRMWGERKPAAGLDATQRCALSPAQLKGKAGR